jgi:hypothetical protein
MKQFFKRRLILVLVALLFSTCYYDEERYFYGEETHRNTSKEVMSARQWYDANVEELSLKAEGDDELQLNLTPRWNDAVVRSNIRTTTVEIPVAGSGSFHFLANKNRRKYEAGDKRYATSLTRLVIQTNRRTGRRIGFLMTASPSAECLEKTDFDPFDKLWYMDVPNNYGGHIVYHDLSGKFVNGWEYKNGKLKHAIHRASNSDSNADMITKSMSSGYSACYIVRVDLLWEICTGYYDADGIFHATSPCTYEWRIGSEYQYCEGYDSWTEFAENEFAGSGGEGEYNPPPTSTPTVTLHAFKTTITLMDSYDLLLTTSSETIGFATFTISNPSGQQYILQSGYSEICNEKAKKPGIWQIQATGLLSSGETFQSNTVSVTVQYPDVNTIQNNGTVSTKMSNVWTETKNAASSNGRSERGFWIYVNTTAMQYECGSTITGTNVSECQGAGGSVVPGSPSESIPNDPTTGGKYAVAFFHTHTPATYCPNTARAVGPSAEDISWHTSNNIPGLLYDYTGSYISDLGYRAIIGGHGKNDPAQIYPINPTRKPTPQF